MKKMKMAIKKFLENVTKAKTWKSLWSSIIGAITGRRPHLLPVPVEEDRVEYGTLPTPDGSYLRYAQYYRMPQNHDETILVLSGRREFIEEYDEVHRDFLKRNYKVWCFDWRGQGASKRFLDDPAKGHIDDYKTYIKDLELFLNEFLRKEGGKPFYIFAHSMGAHIVLRYLLEQRPSDIKGVILSAPMIDIRTGSYPYRVARGIARAMMLSGSQEKYIFGEDTNVLDEEAFDDNPFTHDRARFVQRIRIQKEYIDYVVTGYTFGWLEATFRSIKQLNKKMEKMTAELPVLVLSPERDPVVKSESFGRVLDCFQNAKMHVYPDTGHCLMDERPEIRSQIWQDIDRFLGSNSV